MRSRCLVVSNALPLRRLPSLPCAMLGLALLAAQGPHAFAEGAFALTSASFHAGGTVEAAQVFNQGDCKGGNRSPQLSWHDAPPGTRSFAVTMFDQDAPGRGWWHWAVAGIPATVVSLPENASSSGFLSKVGALEARNDFDTDGYGGPCPPAGKPHRYIITVYALSTADLRLAQGRPALMFDHEISTATLGSARMVVSYGR
ncbi:phosphatidylethanolamine-binding family protein [Paraburkholderia xenovorans LB400]|jgi:Raf kinase inhibitor-like YbhB/YbcL family protein|uniref:Phospholipid-binding protein, PBP family n=1 Tax=Paraburkholderia xenovorans (strain LB400) TaxID=266265 RepID=Q13TD5_PARXL|nr:YbhB/YbcL family Raf kinase inhibitor-like protein [Paraburkholderia xenovorans]ABE32654.1 phospholipid-binding protein, PBP family [Paraburkholderia xenovorans LB400]AIP33297.1 phosphatidylethanolamine-binding family protein [Paraburkholderia xenovorans LB400]